MALAARGGLIASASQDQTVKIWSIDGQRCLRTLKGHTRPVLSLGISETGSTIASGSENGEVFCWDIITGKYHVLRRVHEKDVWAVAMSRDGGTLVSGSRDKTVIWDVAAHRAVIAFDGPESTDCVVAITASADRVACSTIDGRIKILAAPSWYCIQEFPVGILGITCAAFDDSGRLLTTGSIKNEITVWDAKKGRIVRILHGHSALPTSVQMTRDGRFAISGSYDQTIKFWDVVRASCIRTLRSHEDVVSSVSIAPSGHIVASGSWDGTVHCWHDHADRVYRNVMARNPDRYGQPKTSHPDAWWERS